MHNGGHGRFAMIGLGAMGLALSVSGAKAGFEVFGWNRSERGAAQARANGVNVCATLLEVVSQAELIFLCLTNHAATLELLADESFLRGLEGRTLVQLTTITPEESQQTARLLRGAGAEYLDGAVTGLPDRVLEGDCTINYSGPEAVFSRHDPILRALAGRSKHISEEYGAAQTLELARFSFIYGSWLSYFHGAALARAAGIAPKQFVELVAEGEAMRNRTTARYGTKIVSGNHDNAGAELELHHAAMRLVLEASQKLGIDQTIPEVMLTHLERGMTVAGTGQDLSYIHEVLFAPVAPK